MELLNSNTVDKMKIKYFFFAVCSLLLTMTGCKEEEVDTFDSKPGVNFLVDNGYGVYVDDYQNLKTDEDFFNAYFSQKTIDISTTSTISLCVQLEGRLSDKPLNIRLKAEAEDGYEMPELEMPGDSAIAAGEYQKVFNITVHKPAFGEERRCYITFDYANSDVVAGTMERQKYEIIVSDVTPFREMGVTDAASWTAAFGDALGQYGDVKVRFIQAAFAMDRWYSPQQVYIIYTRHLENPLSGFSTQRVNTLKRYLDQYNASHDKPLQEADGTLVTFP